ncbi:AAA family ATPase [Paenibacillus sp. HW567]|uniref:AAA family ATPase n=1 Tax=Paenibacillus sp. HW567 TaxID=1034769 RepID=UPI000380BD6E|nr:AAA family ATPase [Paenibacillus sp. HW567]
MKLKINNFNMISSAEIELSGLTVIAGENDTGKSTIGKLLFSAIKASNMSRVKQTKKNKTPAYEGTFKQVLSLVFDDYEASNSKIIISSESSEVYRIESDHKGWFTHKGNIDSLQLLDATYIESPIVWSLVDFFTTVGKIREQDQMFNIADEIKYPYLLWDLYRKLVLKRSYRVEENETYDQILEAIRKIVGGNITSSFEKFYFNRLQDNKQFPVTTVATGIKSFGLLEILTINKYINPKSIIIIDEPEVHLHPSWEVEYAKLVSQFVRLGVKVIVTTHSLYMVKALREFTKDIPDNVKFYLTSKSENQMSVIEDVSKETHKIFKKFADPLQDIVWGKS